MTLREKVARAICAADCRGDPHVCDMDDHGSHCKPEVCSLWRNYRNGADAALAAVREALREPTPEIIGAWWRVKNGHHFHDEPAPTDTSDYAAYRAMLAASPLAEGNGDG